MYAWKNLGKFWFLKKVPKVTGQWAGRVFKSTISPEQRDEIVWFLAYWYKFIEMKS